MAKTQKSRIPLWVRILILLPLVPIVVSIYLIGQNERVGLFEASLMATSSTADGSMLQSRIPVYLPGSDFTLIDTLQNYDAENLYKKIDGHDVAFFRFGFQSLTFASYGGNNGVYLDVYIYRMDRDVNALGIYGSERSEEREALARIQTGYRSGGGVFFYRGPWYLQVIPSAESASTQAAVNEVTDSLLAIIPAPDAPIPQLVWFPEANRIPLSEGYLPDNAFGTDVLANVFTANYTLDDSRVTAFRHQSDSAAVVFSRYTGFLAEMATPTDSRTIAGRDIIRFVSYGEETWITLSGNDIIGITGIPEGASAGPLMESLLEIASREPSEGPQS